GQLGAGPDLRSIEGLTHGQATLAAPGPPVKTPDRIWSRLLCRTPDSRCERRRSAKNGPKLVNVMSLKNKTDFLIHRVVLQNRVVPVFPTMRKAHLGG
ncbi:MAG TPA: hypothetical protein VLV76_24495, partial [Candidatus Acidoferrum sp.]|nr:hypothetical protein [Candidatus Acidoferrum sp.]